MKMSSLTSTAHHRRSASEIAAPITNAMRRSGRERCCIAEATLEDLVGTRRISRATRRLICHEIQQLGFAMRCRSVDALRGNCRHFYRVHSLRTSHQFVRHPVLCEHSREAIRIAAHSSIHAEYCVYRYVRRYQSRLFQPKRIAAGIALYKYL